VEDLRPSAPAGSRRPAGYLAITGRGVLRPAAAHTTTRPLSESCWPGDALARLLFIRQKHHHQGGRRCLPVATRSRRPLPENGLSPRQGRAATISRYSSSGTAAADDADGLVPQHARTAPFSPTQAESARATGRRHRTSAAEARIRIVSLPPCATETLSPWRGRGRCRSHRRVRLPARGSAATSTRLSCRRPGRRVTGDRAAIVLPGALTPGRRLGVRGSGGMIALAGWW
jgi:hypothetical protein